MDNRNITEMSFDEVFPQYAPYGPQAPEQGSPPAENGQTGYSPAPPAPQSFTYSAQHTVMQGQFSAGGFGPPEPQQDFSDFDPNRYKENTIGNAADTTLPTIQNVVMPDNRQVPPGSHSYSTPKRGSPVASQALLFAFLSLFMNMLGIIAIAFGVIAISKASKAKKLAEQEGRPVEGFVPATYLLSFIGIISSSFFTIVHILAIISQ